MSDKREVPNKAWLADKFGISVKTLNKYHKRHFDKIGPYEFRRWLAHQIKAWKELLGSFVDEQ